MLTAVTGINWGDEGKGRVIDLLAENADIVVTHGCHGRRKICFKPAAFGYSAPECRLYSWRRNGRRP